MLECEAMAILISAQGLGYAHRDKALAAAGSALALLEDPFAYGRELGENGVQAIRLALRRSEGMLQALKREGVSLILREDERYPRLLGQIARPPHLLYCLGQADLSDAFPIAVVGTRSASPYGLRHTRTICRDLAQAGMCIVSGLALGVDAAAHEGALEGRGRTIAVLGSSLDEMYPPENEGLMQRILESGGSVISEYAPGTRPSRYSFLQRNRIIAGMTLGTLITEGPARSGAANTARHALEEGREVFALPGDVDRMVSALPNRLIAEGACLITRASDIIAQLVIEPEQSAGSRRGKKSESKSESASENAGGGQAAKRAAKTEAKPAAKSEAKREEKSGAQEAAAVQPGAQTAALTGAEKAVYDALRQEELDFDALAERTKIASDELGALLMMLELDGVIDALPGCRYRLC